MKRFTWNDHNGRKPTVDGSGILRPLTTHSGLSICIIRDIRIRDGLVESAALFRSKNLMRKAPVGGSRLSQLLLLITDFTDTAVREGDF
jgi:hypothetical protein